MGFFGRGRLIPKSRKVIMQNKLSKHGEIKFTILYKMKTNDLAQL